MCVCVCVRACVRTCVGVCVCVHVCEVNLTAKHLGFVLMKCKELSAKLAHKFQGGPLLKNKLWKILKTF